MTPSGEIGQEGKQGQAEDCKVVAVDALKKPHPLGFEHIAPDSLADGGPIPGNIGVKIGFREVAHHQTRFADVPPDRLALFVKDGRGQEGVAVCPQRQKLFARLRGAFGLRKTLPLKSRT